MRISGVSERVPGPLGAISMQFNEICGVGGATSLVVLGRDSAFKTGQLPLDVAYA